MTKLLPAIVLCVFVTTASAQQPSALDARVAAMQDKLNDELNIEMKLREALYTTQKQSADLMKQWDQESDDEQDADGQSQ